MQRTDVQWTRMQWTDVQPIDEPDWASLPFRSGDLEDLTPAATPYHFYGPPDGRERELADYPL